MEMPYILIVPKWVSRFARGLLLIAFVWHQVSMASDTTFRGFMRIGNNTLDVSLRTWSNDSLCGVVAEVAQGQSVSDRISYTCSRESCLVVYNGTFSVIKDSSSSLWYTQLHSELLTVYDPKRDTAYRDLQGQLIIESRQPFEVTSFMNAEVRFVFEAPIDRSVVDIVEHSAYFSDKVRLMRIQLYSLDEWMNEFEQPVTMTLERVP